MIKVICLFCPLMVGLLFCCVAKSQPANDSAFYASSVRNLQAVYYSAMGAKSRLYNGYEYEYFGRGSKGSPFFLVDTMHAGSVLYDGILYEDVPLRYDIVNDVLLVKYARDNNTIQLLKNKVDHFNILGHQFIRFDELGSNDEFSGFYELLYQDTKVLVFAKRNKKLMLSSNAEERTSAFVQYDQYFIQKGGKYYAVKSEGDLVDAFKDKAREIKKYSKTSNIDFKKYPEQAIVNAATFYNRLTN